MVAVVNILTKAAGIIGTGVVLYDANYKGKSAAKKTAINRNAEIGLKHIENVSHLSNGSHFTANMKKKLLNFEIEHNKPIRTGFNKVKGYINGFTNNLSRHIVPAALSVGALVLKGKVGIASAIGLGVYSIYSFFNHTLDYYRKPF